MKKLTLLAALMAAPIIAQDVLPERLAFAGVGYTATQSAKPEAGFAGIAQKLTDRAGGWYSYTALAVTAKSNDLKTGILKPALSVQKAQFYVAATAGIVTEGQNEVSPAGATFTGSTVGFGVSGGVLVTYPIRKGVYAFAGGQVLGNNVGTQGIDVGGQKVAVGFGVAVTLK